jgi:hypothetical protein
VDNSLVVQLGMNIQSLEAGLNKSNSLLNGFKDKVGEVAKGLAAAFAVERIAEFGVEVTKLAGQTEGVRRVFDQIRGSADALKEMTAATQGTVSQLNLMKYAVQADNFNIPIEQMGKLFDFAHQRALATGQSVDYLVQSIVTGIGRKSPLILDNLGISAVTLREKLKGVGTETASVADVAKVVGEIASESINKFGLAAETNASRIEALGASWENLKVKIGEATSGLAAFVIKSASIAVDILARNGDSVTNILKNEIRIYNEMVKEGREGNFLSDQLDKVKEAAKNANTDITILSDGVKKMVFLTPKPIKIVDAKDLPIAAEIIKNIDFYEKEIKDLREQEKQAIGDNLTKLQNTIELEQKKLEILQNQALILRDQRESSIANNTSLHLLSTKSGQEAAKAGEKGYYTDFETPQLAKTNILPPADNINKANSAIQKSIDLLNKLNHQAPSYTKSFDDIFDEKKIRQFTFALNSGVQSMATDLAIALGSFASGAATSDQIFSTLLSSVGNMAIQLGQLAIGAGIAIEAIQTALTSLEGPVAIAAGVALVALGSAVKGAASNIAKGGGGSVSHTSPSSAYKPMSSQPQQIYGNVILKGQDIAIALSNYQTNSTWTRVG